MIFVSTTHKIFIDSKTLIGSDLWASNKFHVSINSWNTCRHVTTVGPAARPLSFSFSRLAYSRAADRDKDRG